MPLEDKDNQGGTWVASPMNTNSSTKNNKNQERLMEEEHAIVRILISRIEASYKKRSCSTNYELSPIGKLVKPPLGMCGRTA